ncbi:hypothetical protein H0H93_000978 [Arthromyces matolae]|nr:hypothetical protein H0H93_000978 [Arthromyces matolae]
MVGRPQKHLAILEPPARLIFAYVVLFLFLVLVFSLGLSYQFDNAPLLRSKFPDFSNSLEFKTLSAEEFPLDDPSRRVIIVGDIHGMYGPFQNILKKVSYDPHSDVLVQLGDFLTKGPHVGSMKTLDFMVSNNVTAVRGNHDQKVIEWRAWIQWIHTHPGGSRWLVETLAEWDAVDDQTLDEWLADQKRRKKHNLWWKKIPHGWTLFGPHFSIAHAMSEEQYNYLRNLPYIIHIPSAHAFVVHAGVLPSDPKFPYNDRRQPLMKVPQNPECCNNDQNASETTQLLRNIQERGILTLVPQNAIPHNVLNIRSVLDGLVTKKPTGTPWTHIWKHDMKLCAGFDKELSTTPATEKSELLPCYPTTVVYGHAASRGLDIKRWSIGLDTGCVYHRRLTALILGGDEASHTKRDNDREYDDSDDNGDGQIHLFNGSDHDNDGKNDNVADHASEAKFGDSYRGKIISVSCFYAIPPKPQIFPETLASPVVERQEATSMDLDLPKWTVMEEPRDNSDTFDVSSEDNVQLTVEKFLQRGAENARPIRKYGRRYRNRRVIHSSRSPSDDEGQDPETDSGQSKYLCGLSFLGFLFDADTYI